VESPLLYTPHVTVAERRSRVATVLGAVSLAIGSTTIEANCPERCGFAYRDGPARPEVQRRHGRYG
jgi:hypothetical protein